jgi:putative transposase
LRREVFDRLLIVHEYQLRRVLTEYLRHYNTARPHRALGQLTPAQAGTRPQLAANTLRHTDGGGAVQVWRTAGQILCQVADTG